MNEGKMVSAASYEREQRQCIILGKLCFGPAVTTVDKHDDDL
jgi:hypothetical protein